MTDFPANFHVLSCGYDLRKLDESEFSKKCICLKEAGYNEIYFGDIFFEIQKTPDVTAIDKILFEDDGFSVVARPEKELQCIREIVESSGLAIGGAHFLQILPEPRQEVESIFPLHQRLLEMANIVGLKRLTTHAGWQLHTQLLNMDTYDEKMFSDSILAYRNLCSNARNFGINITIETACQSWRWLDENPQRLKDFISKVNISNLGICLDAGHCHVAKLDIKDVILNLGNLIFETHFHDNFGPLYQEFTKCDLHNPVGIGTIDWREVILAMREIGYKGIITFEQPDYKINATNWNLFLAAIS